MDNLITFLNATGKTFVDFSSTMLVQSSVLIIVLLALDMLLRKKVRAVFRYCIWMLVLVKLVLPTTLSSPTGIGYWFGDKLPAIVSEEVSISERTATILPNIEPVSEKLLPEVAIAARPSISTVHEPVSDITAAESEVATPPAVLTASLSWHGLVFLGWLAAAGAMALLLVQRMFFVRGLLAQSKEPGDSMVDVFEKCRGQMKIRGKVNLKLSPVAGSPSVCGLFRATILIPEDLPGKLKGEDLRSILLHELAHIKRGDLPISLVQTILQIAYFYNPLLWVANAIIRKVREQAVDEMVLVAMGGRAEDYPETLLNISRLTFSRPVLSLRLIGVVESKKALSGRIKHILSRPFPKTAKLGFVGLLAIIVTAAILLPMAKAAYGAPEFIIKGTVTDAETGRPIAGAKVGDNKEYNDGKCCTFTDLNGNYSYKTWYEEHGTIAEADGYKSQLNGFNTKLFGSEKEIVIDFELASEKAAEQSGFTATLPNGETVEDSRNLLIERRDILQKTLQTLEQKSKAGLVASKELQQAKIDLLRVEGELAESPQKQIEILGQIVALYKEQEKRTQLLLDAGRATQDELDKAKLLRLEAEAELANTKAEGNNQQTRFKTTLPNGVTVELVGVCDYPDGKARCWKADGSELEKQIYVKRERDYSDGKYGFILQVAGPEDLSFAWNKIKGSNGYWGSCKVLDDQGDTVEGFEAAITRECDSKETTDVRVGIAAGTWETIAASNGKGMRIQSSQAYGKIAFSKAYESDNFVHIVVTDDSGKNVVQRIVAIDTNDKLHIWSGNYGSVSSGDIRQTEGSFANLKLSRIKEFQFQTRPYEWVEFKNVSLKPGFKTDAVIEGERQFVIEARVFSIELPNTSIPNFLYSKLGIENVNTEAPLTMPVQLTDEQADEFEKWVAAIPDTTTLVSPKVTAVDDELVDLSVTTQHERIMSYKKPEDSLAKPEPVFEKFTTGVKLNITPKMQRDGKTIILKIAFSKIDLIGVEKNLNESGNEIEIPLLNTSAINTSIGVPNGKNTLVPVAGLFSAARTDEHGKPIHQTLLLIKPTILSPTSSPQNKLAVQVEGKHWNVKTNLPQDVIDQRNALLAEADAKIRLGLVELADKFPQLKKARDWESIISGKSPNERIEIWLRHTHKGKAKTTNILVPENEQTSVLVMLLPPPEKVWAMGLGPVYPNLGLVGQVNATAGNPELEAAFKNLVDKALEPLKRFDESLNDEKPAVQVDNIALPSIIGVSENEQKPKAATRLKIIVYDGGKEPEVSLTIPLPALKIANALLPPKIREQLLAEGIDLDEVLKQLDEGLEPTTLLEVKDGAEHIIIALE